MAPRSDGQIEMDVVHALDASQALKNDLITAATIQSEVTLSGTVSSDSSKQLAESIAKTVPGVTKVHNNLKVGNPADDANAQGAPVNDPSNDMADAQAPRRRVQQDNGQYAEPGQNAPSINQAPPPNWGDQNQQQPGYGQQQPRLMDSSSRLTGSKPPDQRPAMGSSLRLRDTGSTALRVMDRTTASSGVRAASGLCAGSASAAVCRCRADRSPFRRER